MKKTQGKESNTKKKEKGADGHAGRSGASYHYAEGCGKLHLESGYEATNGRIDRENFQRNMGSGR